MTARGLFGFEGRALIMWNNLPLNDLQFGSYNFGDDLPIHMIDRIEVIRGPGSVLYGGTAELAVINIITKSGSQLEGGNATARYGTLENNFGHRDLSAQFGKKDEDWEYSSLVTFGESMQSSGSKEQGNPAWSPPLEYREDIAYFKNSTFSLSGIYKEKTTFKLLDQQYLNNQLAPCEPDAADPTKCLNTEAYRHSSSTSSSGAVSPNAAAIAFHNYGGQVSHEFQLGGSLVVKPSLEHMRHHIWQTEASHELATERTMLSVPFSWKMPNWEFVAGADSWVDAARITKKDSNPSPLELRKSRFDSPREYLAITNQAFYTNVNYHMDSFFWTAGVRHDKNEIFGEATSPRLGLTYVNGPFHSKFLLANAFRAPLFGNNAVSSWGFNPLKPWREDVKPEKAQVAEIELGYLYSENISVVVNIFNQQVKDVIEFKYLSAAETGSTADLFSANGGTISTYGSEFELKYKQKGRYSGLLNFSFVQLGEKGGTTYLNYSTDSGDNNSRLLGVPSVKIYTNHSFSISDRVSFQFNALYLAEKDAERFGDPNLTYMEQYKIPAQTILGIGMIWSKVAKNTDVSVVIHDLTDEQMKLVTPYKDSGFAPITWKGREVLSAVTYSF